MLSAHWYADSPDELAIYITTEPRPGPATWSTFGLDEEAVGARGDEMEGAQMRRHVSAFAVLLFSRAIVAEGQLAAPVRQCIRPLDLG